MSKIYEVGIPWSQTKYDVTWDWKAVYVGSEYAGTASTKSDAIHVADYYASTGRTKDV